MPNTRRDLVPRIEGAPARVEPLREIPSGGAEEAFKTQAAVFGQMSAQIGAIADHAATVEGAREGHTAGLDPEFRPRGDLTLYGEAYDRAAIDTYTRRMHVEVTGQMEQAFDTFKDDPKGLDKALAAVKGGWQGKLFPQVVPEFEALWNRQRIGHLRAAVTNAQARIREEQFAALSDDLAIRLRAIDQQAFRLGLDPKADAVLAGEYGELNRKLGAVGPDGRPLVNPATALKVLRQAEDTVARSRIVGAFTRLDTPEARARFITGLEEQYAKGDNALLNRFDVQHYESLISHLRTLAHKDGMAASVAVRQLAKDVKRRGRMAEEGIELAGPEESAMRGQLAAIGTPELIDAFNEQTNTLATTKILNRMTPVEIEAAETALRAGLNRKGASLEGHELDRLHHIEKYRAKMHEELARDQVGRAVKTGLIDIQPLDLSSGETVAAGLKARAAAVETAARHYGRDVKYFRVEERDALASIAREGGQKLAGLAAGVVQALGSDAPAALAEIIKDAPEAAWIGHMMLTGASDQAIKDAVKGVELRRHKDFKPLIANTIELRDELKNTIGTVFRAMPDVFDSVVRTAATIYEVRARKEGQTTFDRSLYDGILDEVLGQVWDTTSGYGSTRYGGIGKSGRTLGLFGGNPVIVPSGTLTNGFDNLIGALREEDLRILGVPKDARGGALTVRDIKNATGRFVTVGSGRYVIATTSLSETQPQYMTRDGRQEYILDLNLVLPTLRERRPDLFVGGNLALENERRGGGGP